MVYLYFCFWNREYCKIMCYNTNVAISERERRGEMKNWKKGLAAIGIGVFVVLVGVGIWQRENAQAIWEGMSYNEDELKTQMETSKEKIQNVLEDYGIEGIRDLTVEEEEQLMKGELTVEEVLDLIMKGNSESNLEEKEALVGKYELDQSTTSTENNSLAQNNEASSNNGVATNNSVTQSQTSTSAASSAESTKVETKQIVEKYVEKMYTLQATFLSELGKIEARARTVYAQLPKEERNLSTAQKLAPSFINQGIALENSCDSQVNAILSDFEAELKKAGASTVIVGNMKEAYQTQKRLKKAYYLSVIK